MGLLVGDGTLKEDKAVLSVWDVRMKRECNGGVIHSPGVAGIMHAAEVAAFALPHRADFRGWQAPIDGRGESRLVIGELRSIALGLGLAPGAKRITPALEDILIAEIHRLAA